MKKMMIVFIFVNVLMAEGVSLENKHYRNIKSAITQFSSTFTNDMLSASYDCTAILEEIKNVKCEVVRKNLLTDLASQFIVNHKDIWKHKDALWFQRRRTRLTAKVLYLVDDKNIMFKWQRYLDLLQAMKAELVIYADVRDPDAYRDRWIAEAKEGLKEELRRLGTNRNVIICGTVPISKARREAGAKWAYKKSIEREIARYEKRYFDSLVLKDDYRKLTAAERKQLIEMVKEGLGRYPKWYRKDLEDKLN